AEHRILGRRAAVKVLHRALAARAAMVERFAREARAVNQIRHPNIVDIYEFGRLPDGRPYFVMELLGGNTLESLLRARRRLPAGEVVALLEPVCAALDAAHRAGVIHRDLKAANVAIDPTPDGGVRVKLLDFGVAKLLNEDGAVLTSVDCRLGTPQVMAPEQLLAGPVDARTDVYALGVLTFRLLTGRHPVDPQNPIEPGPLPLEGPRPLATDYAHVPAAVDSVLHAALARDPAHRFQSARAFITALRSAVGW